VAFSRHSPLPLTPRDREILRDIVHTYILSGEPVSSRAVAKHDIHGLSAATIRNVMADLEEAGYLEQPHTSAGRVPSSAGYHLYIESLADSPALPERDRRYIDERLQEQGGTPDQLVSTASQLLSELSSQIGLVLTPAIGDTVLKAVDFVPLSGTRVLCVVISASGFIENKLVELEEELTRDELVRIANYITENFSGLTLRDVRERLLRMMADERAQVDKLLGRVIALARSGLGTEQGPEVVVQGTTSVLHRPELGSVDRVRRLLDTFVDRERLVGLLNRCIVGAGVRVVIGEESLLTSDLDFSLVGRSYEVPGRAQGTVGIFGPSRMEYMRVIPLVDYLGEALSRALEQTFGE
jgi:heat-inducible transcriptional repressor